MKLSKIIYNPFIPIILTAVFLIIGFRYGNVIPQRHDDTNPETVSTPESPGANINSRYYVSKGLGFSFEVSDGFTVLVDANGKDHGQVVVVKTSYAERMARNPNNKEPLDAVIISPEKTSPAFPALSWLKSKNSGYNLASGYQEITIDGEKAYLLDWHGKGSPDGALFDNPDKTLRFSVVTFGASPSKEMTAELENILRTFSFNK